MILAAGRDQSSSLIIEDKERSVDYLLKNQLHKSLGGDGQFTLDGTAATITLIGPTASFIISVICSLNKGVFLCFWLIAPVVPFKASLALELFAVLVLSGL